jgi:phenylalanyl-tRNA synthetase alpha chain
MSDLATLVAQARSEFDACTDPAALENAKARYLGKSGALTDLLKGLGKLSAEERPAAGAAINVAKQQLEDALAARRTALADAKLAEKLAADALDVSLPGRGRGMGTLHPLTRVQERIETSSTRWVHRRRRSRDRGRLPQLHRAQHAGEPSRRARCRTRSTSRRHGLRTHTSPIQVRYMEAHKPPIKIIAPGRVYRVDSDATHSPMFHQVEGLWIDRDVTFADLKATITEFLRRFFERDDLKVRFRPSFFRSPSRPRKSTWLRRRRLARARGLGQVHPNVLRAVSHRSRASTRASRSAWGPDRSRCCAMHRRLRLFYENDLRFLRQFA